MSMVPHNLFFHNPFGLLDHFFNDDMQLQLRDHAGKLSVSPNGDFTYKVDTSGFQPSEVSVDISGDDIVVKGHHHVQGEHEMVDRSFVRRLRIPSDIPKDSITCELDGHGKLTIKGKKAAVQQPQTRSIPINIKPNNPAAK